MVIRGELKTRAKEQLNDRLWLCIGTTLIFSIIIGLNSSNNEVRHTFGLGWGASIDLVTLLLAGALTVGYAKFLLNVVNKRNPKFVDLFSGFNIYLKTLGLYFITMASIVVGMIFFIIPGIIIALAFAMAPYILAEDDSKGIIEVLKESREMMKGHKLEYLVLEFSFILWFLLGIITFGLGLLWVMPYIQLTDANYYMELKQDFVSKEII